MSPSFESEPTLHPCQKVKDTPSLKFLVDFGVWFRRWIFWWIFTWIFSGPFPWENKREKIHRKIHQKIHGFQGNFLTKIHSGKFLPWQKGVGLNMQRRCRHHESECSTKAGHVQVRDSDKKHKEAVFGAPQKGPENWCRAKIVEKCRKYFWHFLTNFDVFCPARKLSKSVEKLFDTFWRFLTFFDVAPFRRPLLQSADVWQRLCRTFGWTFWCETQRAENGGLDPSCLGLAFLGRPDFQSGGPNIHVLKGFGTFGRYKHANSKHDGPNPPFSSLWKTLVLHSILWVLP